MKKRVLSVIIAAAMTASLASCGAGGSGHSATNGASPAETRVAGADYGMYEGAPTTTAAAYDESYDAAEYTYDAGFESIAADSYSEDRRSDIDAQRRAGLLTGGEWRDNSNFVFWTKLFEQRSDWAAAEENWKITTRDRVFVRVKDNSGNPAAGMTVKLAGNKTILWETVTDSRGEAFLYQTLAANPTDDITRADEIIVEAADGRAVTTALSADYKPSDTATEITVPDSSPMRTQLDLMLMLDTTGSMGDELSYLKTELKNVINRVVDETQADVQLSVNFYRDNGDDYVVRDFGFTKNISIALEHLQDQRSEGGGDYPEAVMDAIGNGLYKHEWRADSEKIMLLVLDAPPHRGDALTYLESHMHKAAQMGVRIIPVASSGVDTDTEFLCRCMAMATGGTYTFLTDDSGVGYSHLEPTIGSYKVEKLNDMLVRVISEYFSQEPRQSASSTQTSADTGAPGRYPAAYTYTYDYFSGEGMYTTGVVRNAQEAAEFREKYGISPENLIKGISYDRSAFAYKVDMLSSGSISVDDSKGVYVTLDESGEPKFHYELDIPSVGTTEIMTLFVFAEIPAEQ